MKRTSRLRKSLVSRWKTFYAAVPLVRLRPRGTPARSLRRDRTSRPARHRFTARLDARACRGRGSVSELVVEVGSPGWARTSDPLINSQVLYRLSYRGTFVSGTAMVPDLAAALQPRGRLRRVGVRAARLEGVGSAGRPARRHHHGRAPPGARAPPEPEGELASEIGEDRRQWSESRGSRKEPRTCPHAVPTVRSGAADTEENSSADSG